MGLHQRLGTTVFLAAVALVLTDLPDGPQYDTSTQSITDEVRSRPEKASWHVKARAGEFATVKVDGTYVIGALPTHMQSSEYHPICDMRNPAFKLKNLPTLNKIPNFDASRGKRWMAAANVLRLVLGLLLSLFLLPQNAMGDVREWRVIGAGRPKPDENQKDHAKQKDHADFTLTSAQFSKALGHYWGGPFQDEHGEYVVATDNDTRSLFDWITCGQGDKGLSYLSHFSKVQFVPCVFSGKWKNGNWELAPAKDMTEDQRNYYISNVFTAFGRSEECWTALLLAAGLFRVSDIFEDYQSRKRTSSTIHADHGPVDGRYELQQLILKRFNPNLHLHERMEVEKFIPPSSLPEELGQGGQGGQRAFDPQRSNSYMLGMMNKPAILGGLLYMPYSHKAGMVIFCFNVFYCTWSGLAEVVESIIIYLNVFEHARGFSWEHLFLTFKTDVYIPYFFLIFSLILLTLKWLSMVGLDPYARRHGGSKLFILSWRQPERIIFFVPAITSVGIMCMNILFIPVTILHLGTCVCVLQILEPICRRYFPDSLKDPCFTTAPLLTCMILKFPVQRLSQWLLPDTYLCNWSHIEIISEPMAKNLGLVDISQEVPSDIAYRWALSFLPAAAVGLSIVVCLALAVWLFLRLAWVERFCIRCVYQSWMRQSNRMFQLLFRKSFNDGLSHDVSSKWERLVQDGDEYTAVQTSMPFDGYLPIIFQTMAKLGASREISEGCDVASASSDSALDTESDRESV